MAQPFENHSDHRIAPRALESGSLLYALDFKKRKEKNWCICIQPVRGVRAAGWLVGSSSPRDATQDPVSEVAPVIIIAIMLDDFGPGEPPGPARFGGGGFIGGSRRRFCRKTGLIGQFFLFFLFFSFPSTLSIFSALQRFFSRDVSYLSKKTKNRAAAWFSKNSILYKKKQGRGS